MVQYWVEAEKVNSHLCADKKLDEKQSTNKSRTQTKKRNANISWWLDTMLETFGATLMMLTIFFWSKNYNESF